MTRRSRLALFVAALVTMPGVAQNVEKPLDPTEVGEAATKETPQKTDSAPTEATKESTAKESAPDSTTPVSVPTLPEGTPRTKSPDVFVPSEDISEDLAVSFPVDI